MWKRAAPGSPPSAEGAGRWPDPLRSVLATVALCQPGGISMVIAPALLAMFADRGRFSPAQASTFGAAELAGMTLAILATSALVGRIDRRRYALIALGTAVAGQLLTLYAAADSDYAFVTAARTIVGLGEGGLTGVAVAAIAGLRAPDRGFGLAIPGNLIGGALIFALMPRMIAAGGLQVLLIVIIAYTALSGMFIPAFPRRSVLAKASEVQGGRQSIRMLLPGLLALLGTLLFLTGIGMVWPITAQIGHARGVSAAVTASALSNAGLAGAAAGLGAAWLGGLFPRLPLLVLGTAGAAIAMSAIALPLGERGFTLCAIGIMVWWVFSITFYFGTLAAMDASGRLVAMSTALQTFGLALGQGLAVLIGGTDSVAIVTRLGAALATMAALAILAATHLRRRIPDLRATPAACTP